MFSRRRAADQKKASLKHADVIAAKAQAEIDALAAKEQHANDIRDAHGLAPVEAPPVDPCDEAPVETVGEQLDKAFEAVEEAVQEAEAAQPEEESPAVSSKPKNKGKGR